GHVRASRAALAAEARGCRGVAPGASSSHCHCRELLKVRSSLCSRSVWRAEPPAPGGIRRVGAPSIRRPSCCRPKAESALSHPFCKPVGGSSGALPVSCHFSRAHAAWASTWRAEVALHLVRGVEALGRVNGCHEGTGCHRAYLR